MFQVYSLSTPRISVDFGHSRLDENRIDVLTGPNGSGKTEVLTALSTSMSGRISNRVDTQASMPPRRVIAQTFSPFSRFPPPKRQRETLSDIYREESFERDCYSPIGMYRGIRATGNAFSRKVVEQSLYRLSERVERTVIVGRVLTYLGFQPEIELIYGVRPQSKDILWAAKQSDGSVALANQLALRQTALRALAREIVAEGMGKTAELIKTSVDVLPEFDQDSGRIHHRQGLFGTTPSSSYAELQALSVLRRLNLLRLERCTLQRAGGGRVELSHASSGQQQLLCSLFGLAGEIDSDSLILIDEPELSLHPTWQASFLDHLQNILLAVSGCHVIIATHSPLLVQKAQELNLGVTILSEGEDGQQFDTNPNASVEEALINVFEVPVPRSLYLTDEIIRAVNEADELDGSAAATRRLMELRQVYANSPELKVIDRALRFVADGEAK